MFCKGVACLGIHWRSIFKRLWVTWNYYLHMKCGKNILSHLQQVIHFIKILYFKNRQVLKTDRFWKGLYDLFFCLSIIKLSTRISMFSLTTIEDSFTAGICWIWITLIVEKSVLALMVWFTVSPLHYAVVEAFPQVTTKQISTSMSFADTMIQTIRGMLLFVILVLALHKWRLTSMLQDAGGYCLWIPYRQSSQGWTETLKDRYLVPFWFLPLSSVL